MKITTLIPAFKPKYLDQLLLALRHQTVRPERIIFSDDSPDRAFGRALRDGGLSQLMAGLNIEIIDGPRAGCPANVRRLLLEWRADTDLVHFLFDDDIIYPDFYARHLAAHANGAHQCSISRRWTALESGQPVSQLRLPKPVARHPHRLLSIDSDIAFASTVPHCINWMGEFSNAVFCRDLYDLLGTHVLSDIAYDGLEDIGTFLRASLREPLCFLNEPLGFFRRSAEQITSQTLSRPVKKAHLAWIALALAGRRIGKLEKAQAIACFNGMGRAIRLRYAGEADMAPFCELIPELMAGTNAAGDRFLDAWNNYLETP